MCAAATAAGDTEIENQALLGLKRNKSGPASDKQVRGPGITNLYDQIMCERKCVICVCEQIKYLV
jgi:hypothetical protein